MNMDPYIVAVGLIGDRELTDQLLTEITGTIRQIAPDLDDDAIDALRRQLESSIGIRMSVGQGLHDGAIAPWVENIKSSIEWSYWNAYVKQLRSRNFAQGVLRVLDEDTDNILTECGNPMEEGPWSSKGLVMGDVQSGKTASYCGLICKAADAGYKVIVLLTGMIEDLRAQSQERLDEGFVGRDSRDLLDGDRRSNKVIGAGRFNRKRPNVLTSISSDFLRANYRALGGIPLQNISEPVLLVVKKNTSPLSNLVEFLDSQRHAGRKLDLPLLIIDDESDNASVNVRKDGEDPATINRLIRELPKRFSRSSYVGYTATPFANVFINPDLDDDLFPSNFVYSLNTPSSYLGVGSYFSDGGSHASCVHDITDAATALPYGHRKDFPVEALPPSMLDAMGVFLLCCAIRDLRKEPLRHRSMLVNASRFTDVQARIAEKLATELYLLVEDIKQYLGIDDWARHDRLRRLHELWSAHYASAGPSWDTVRAELYESVSTVRVITINQKTEAAQRLNYGLYAQARFGRRVIAVGGLTLSRGLTLEGLCVSYFLRNSRAYDTLLQMGRWFGYRPGYDDLCRIWADPLAQGWYAHLSEVVNELRVDIRRMHAQRLPPGRFGMKVRTHTSALAVTAANKMRHADSVVIALSYSAAGAETPLLPVSRDRNLHNLTQLKAFINGLPPATLLRQRLYWESVPRAQVAHFLESLEILDLNPHFMRDGPGRSRPLLDFIATNTVGELSTWEVCLPQGDGTRNVDFDVETRDAGPVRPRPRKRQFERVRGDSGFLRLNKQRVGEISDERVGIPDSERQRIDEEWARERERDSRLGESVPGHFYRRFRTSPLLTIHVVEPTDPPPERRSSMLARDEIEPELILAVSVSFPEFDGGAHQVKYALNKVALREAGLLGDDDDEGTDGDED